MTPEVDAVLTTPVVAAAALGALLVLVAASRSARAFGTIAHESGHRGFRRRAAAAVERASC